MSARDMSPAVGRDELVDALATLDHGARFLEDAYRELWAAREAERGASEIREAERVRDLCHEIGNPLAGVRGLARLLERELDAAPATERAHRLLEKMVRGLDALSGIVAREAERPAEAADAGMIAEEAVGLTLAANRAEGGCVRFRVHAPTGIELPILASHFREIVANLARNATEACGADGTVEVTITSSLDAVILEVRDDGPGLPPVSDDVLFRRGFSTKGTGRGRGLALVDECVRSAGGTLRLGRMERGTLARVHLPRGARR